ncbi:TonB-dependent receptor [Pendulispora rubella]|uniref:TonB-dependent receptor n=1 Tax=Pendulispora rubella TaxID=2741070 RepID=A0ABZ2LGV1_9BACT
MRLGLFRPHFGPSIAAFFIAATTVTAANAQQGAAVLTGKIVDASSGRGLADTVVALTSLALQGEQVVSTDDTGTYRIPSLPPGTYTLRLEKPGYRLYARDQIQLRADATIRLDADLLPESLSAQEVSVTAHAPTIDVGSTTGGTNVNADFVSRIPLVTPGASGGAQRSFESVAQAAPGAHADLYGTSINGTTSPENSYVIDGMRTNSPKYGTNGAPLSMEFVKELNVLSSGYMPEYGRSTGGVLNVVTKSGSNEYHGSAWANWTPGNLEGARQYPYFTGTAVQTRRSLANVYDIGFDQSGPIIKDRLWYYVGFDVARTVYNLDRSVYKSAYAADGSPTGTSELPGLSQRYKATATSYQLFAKLDYRHDANNKFALTFAATPMTAGGSGEFALNPNTGLVEYALNEQNLAGSYSGLARTRYLGAYDTILNWVSSFDNKSKNLETTLGWHHELDGSLGADGFAIGSGLGFSAVPGISSYRRSIPSYHDLSDFENVPGCGTFAAVKADGTRLSLPTCPMQTYRAGGPGFTDEQVLDTYAAKSVLTILAKGLGHHIVKVGADLELSTSWHNRGYSGTRLYSESSNGTRFDEWRGYGYLKGPDDPVFIDRLVTRSNSINVGGFVQETWAIADKITVNAGIRYDSQFLIGTDGKLFMSFPHQVSPRIGAIFDPTQHGRSKIFASYARYYESVPLNIADRGTGESHVLSTARGAACDPLNPSMVRVCQSDEARQHFNAKGGWGSRGLPDRTYGPYVSGKVVVDPDLSPQSTSEVTAGGEYELVKNGRIGATYVRRWLNNAVESMSNDETASYFVGNPGKGIAREFPEAIRNYDSGTAYFMKTFADGWLAQISYTLSWLRGNLAGLYKPETAQLDPNSTTTFDLKSMLVNQVGDLPGDRRHSIKVYAAKDFALSRTSLLTLGGSIQARSGAPTNFLGSHPIYGPDEVYILPRGSGERLPWTSSANTHVGYMWRFESGVSLSVAVDIFNLLNFDAVLGRDERYTRADVLPIPNGSRADLANGVKTATGGALSAQQVNPNFGSANQYQEPRQFRFGIRGSF